jgi:hypothetical protein
MQEEIGAGKAPLHANQPQPWRCKVNRSRKLLGVLAIAVTAVLVLPVAAPGDWGIEAENFGIEAFDGQYVDRSGSVFTQAGGHPHEVTFQIEVKSHPDTTPGYAGLPTPNGQPKDIEVELPAGFVGNATVAPQCTAAQLTVGTGPACPIDSVVGTTEVHFNGAGPAINPIVRPVFNMVPPLGVAARFGFNVFKVPIVLDARVKEDGRIVVGPRNTPQALRMWRADTTIWGVPADPAHDFERCTGYQEVVGEQHCGPFNAHEAGIDPVAFLTMPTRCTSAGVGIEAKLRTDSWFEPGVFHSATTRSHQPPNYPEPPGPEVGTSGCQSVPFTPKLDLQPTSLSAESPTGLQVRLDIPTDGLANPEGVSQSHLKEVKVTMPEGLTINPSQAEGLGVCTTSDLDRESASSNPGEGCPSSSKVGSVLVETPLLDHPIGGEVYLAKPYENPLGALIAIYIVLKDKESGISIALPGRVEGSETTGRLTATFKDLPQVAFSSFQLRFREGARSALINPATCGTHTTDIEFTPWADPSNPLKATDTFQIETGVRGGPCPVGGLPPFNPTFQAGTIDNAAGSFSPVVMRLTREDGEQEMTKFSAVLPKGVTGKLAGLSRCTDAAIALAPTKSGHEEIASPSCPASSHVGNVQVGAGAGAALTFVSGKVYLAGPYQGAPLSVAVITPAVAGPFDIGTVVVREALTVDPRTAEVRVDGNKSDPIPHILEGIPLKLRELRILADRPNFIINPTSCEPSATNAFLWGSHFELLNPADDVPVALSSRFQAADCAALPFKPRLDLRLSGATKRGGFPKFTATLNARPGDANLSYTQVTLPQSAFLEQSHLNNICTRVQFAADDCPKGSVYGQVRAFTPILDDPLEGPVVLRSSDNELPDLVFDLHGLVDIEAVARIDSHKGAIRATVEGIPDAPIDKVIVSMKGGQKSLIVNSRNLCKGTHRGQVRMRGQNGKQRNFKPKVKAKCKKRRAKR